MSVVLRGQKSISGTYDGLGLGLGLLGDEGEDEVEGFGRDGFADFAILRDFAGGGVLEEVVEGGEDVGLGLGEGCADGMDVGGCVYLGVFVAVEREDGTCDGGEDGARVDG